MEISGIMLMLCIYIGYGIVQNNTKQGVKKDTKNKKTAKTEKPKSLKSKIKQRSFEKKTIF